MCISGVVTHKQMRKFLEEIDSVSKQIEVCQEDSRRMGEATRRVSGASDEKEAEALRTALDEERDDFIKNMAEIKEKIKELKKGIRGKSEHKKHVKQQQIRSLVERTKKTIEAFSSVQSEFSSEERERIKSQYIIARPTATKEELEAVEYSESPQIPFLKHTVSDSRKKSVKNISRGIKKVMKMTQELNLLVHEKDQDVDKISISTEKAEVKAKKADQDLKSAEKYQKIARLGRITAYTAIGLLIGVCLLILFGGFVIFIIVAIMNYRISKGAAGSDGASSGTSGGTAPEAGASGDAPSSNPSLSDAITAITGS
ncbi:uncharacterized protein NEMAJ01_1451 [Nematocida major]|uniref:uncharacterized protein n=1 Tax=Nematocida major TaxID=1912982 RepID=UPI00200879AF|nr:uncharacterized protein NEMAJ01_1451 [Nematocida major]KAH9386555.1 hypothetical protein NEMAJ01_1451 [Nematocida major]